MSNPSVPTTSYPYRPDYAVPPGETLRDRLAEMNLSQAELAARTGLSTKHINQIVQGIAPLTPDTAIALERVTGVPAHIWNRRESDYRDSLIRQHRRTLDTEDRKWLASLPIKELQRRGRLPMNVDQTRLFDEVLAFFGVANRDAWSTVWRRPIASFRRSTAYRSDPGAVIAWLRIAQLDSHHIAAAPYSAIAFRKTLRQVRALTRRGDINEMVTICAEAGVVVVFVPEVAGCRISGATWWAGPTRAIIALSDRWKKDDRFWFSFFHEAAHVLLHSKKETYVDDGSEDDLLEREADRFAAAHLISPTDARLLPTLNTKPDVIDFAERIGVSPGIVVGRLQHDGLWPWNRGNDLKNGLRIIEG
jgi:HTH-type transcriptional regulator/antitoxin HigA